MKVHECTHGGLRNATDLWDFRLQSDVTRALGDVQAGMEANKRRRPKKTQLRWAEGS